MAFTKISKLGEDFVHSKVNGSGNSFLSGKASDKHGSVQNNPTKVLPNCYPLTNVNKQWTSNPAINGGIDYPNGIETNDELANALIFWYNKYGRSFKMDANIMLAQAYIESNLKVWNYSVIGTASGVSQFVDNTFLAVIQNKRGNFTDAELEALTTGMSGYTYQPGLKPEQIPKGPFLVSISPPPVARYNRPITHQNMIDNPEIMIKAQFDYMKYISGYCNGLASSTLFRYNRGLIRLKVTSSYTEVIDFAKAPKFGTGYENEGIDYVYKTFKLLYEEFGYIKLNITDKAAANFDKKFNPFLG